MAKLRPPQVMFTHLAKSVGITYQEAKIVFNFQHYLAEFQEQRDNQSDQDRPDYGRIRASRLEVCRKCENLVNDTCAAIKKKCGCSSASSPYKSYHAKCPLGKWQG